MKYGKALILKGGLKILGKQPVLKVPGSSKVILGDKVVLNSDFKNSNTALTYRCTLVCGYNASITIGDNTMLNGVAVTAYSKVTIGANCQIASNTIITDTDYHPVDPETRKRQVLGYKYDFDTVGKKEVNIGNNVWIGWGATILKGVTIGDNSIIAAGSVVTQDVPANVLVAGNPAVVKKKYD
ncbi:MAG: acyltransferase [Bacteroidetes bacterium]|nr:acyltransferase [Bacteroidota bacterium]